MKKPMIKPEIVEMDVKLEGVYASSGDDKRKCLYGRRECNPNADTCQACSYTGGTSGTGQYFAGDFKGCPYGMPYKG